jgi:hypothetical protein
MSLLTRIIMEAERISALEFIREEGLRAVMQAAARQANMRREPTRQEPAPAGPARVGTPITDNPAGQPVVSVVGRATRPTKPIRSTKSTVVPEPDQLQSAPPTRRSSPLEPPGY